MNFRQSAPTDGRDPFGVDPKIGYYTSKQNSDANGMKYQCGRKEPFTFATNSEKGGVGANDCGKYPVKIYTIDGVLIYQESNGSDNKGKQPTGGVVNSSISATSMMETIRNPITFYGSSAVVNQYGHTRDLWDHYWTSYSRGTDGYHTGNSSWHNKYLDGYTSQRLKSIYDPCPFGFRVPTNGTYNQFQNTGWITYSYTGGNIWNINSVNSWIQGLGWRAGLSNQFIFTGFELYYRTSTLVTQTTAYTLWFTHSKTIGFNRNDRPHYDGHSVRCIEKSWAFM